MTRARHRQAQPRRPHRTQGRIAKHVGDPMQVAFDDLERTRLLNERIYRFNEVRQQPLRGNEAADRQCAVDDAKTAETKDHGDVSPIRRVGNTSRSAE